MAITKASSSAVAPAAKGDLVVGNATNDSGVLAVGSTDQVLTVDSSTATGLKWATPAGGADSVYNLRNAGSYVKQFGTQAVGEIVVVEDVTWYIPIFLSAGSFDRIAVRTSTGWSGSNVTRLGLYNASTTTGKPTTVVFDAGTVTPQYSSTNYEITISQTVSSGWYFLAVNCQTVVDTPAFVSILTNSSPLPGILHQGSTVQAANSLNFYSQTGVTGAFATAGTLVAPASQAPLVALRNA